MRRRATSGLICLAMLAALAATMPARAAFHLVKVREVFVGTVDQPNVQFIELQYSATEGAVGGHPVRLYDASGVEITSYTLTSPTNATAGSSILLATTEAQNYFTITANHVMPSAAIPAAGGKVCFDSVDCVSWGSYSGSAGAGGTATGTPFNVSGGGLVPWASAERKLSGTSMVDTGNSAPDFALAGPSPRNNQRLVGAAQKVVGFSQDVFVGAAGSSATISLSRSNTTGSLTVQYATQDDTAVAPGDYTATSGTATFADGDATTTFSVPVAANSPSETEEFVNLSLSNPSAGVGGRLLARLLIPSDAPGAPSNLTASAGQTQITLNWSAPLSSGNSPLDHYNIYGGDNSMSLTKIGESPAGITTFTESGLPTNKTRFYRVSGVNTNGLEGPTSNLVIATTGSGDTAPPSVFISTANPSVIVGGSPKIYGTATDNVQVSSISIEAWQTARVRTFTGVCIGCPAASVSFNFTLTGLTPGPYEIRVIALDSGGRSTIGRITVVFVN